MKSIFINLTLFITCISLISCAQQNKADTNKQVVELENKKYLLDYWFFEDESKRIHLKNQHLLNEAIKTEDDSNIIILNSLDSMAISLLRHIDIIKDSLVIYVEDSNLQTINLLEINELQNFKRTTEFMIGDVYDLNKGPWSALKLKTKLIEYNRYVLNAMNDSLNTSTYLPINLASIERENGIIESWEIINFYGQPLSNVLTRLTFIQYNIVCTQNILLLSFKKNRL